MSNKADLQTLDIVYRGNPFVPVTPSTAMPAPGTLETLYRAEPFWFYAPEAGPPTEPTYDSTRMFAIF